MNKEEYWNLNDDAKFEYLNQALAAGKKLDDLLGELELSKQDLFKQGFYYVDGKMMRKPVKGYRTSK